jgi:Mg2+-importing ATPase
LNVKEAPATEWDNCVFLGSSVVSGIAHAVVVATGNLTEYGKIAQKLVAKDPETEFDRGLRKFGFLIMQVTFLLVAFVFIINALYKRDVLESFLFAIALAIGLTPELLPMILSVNLSKGALQMSKKGVIVKRLAAIQNFGGMDILCTDKTGTLTENRITLVQHIDLNGKDDERVLLYSYINSRYETGLKSPLDAAILAHENIDIKGYEKIDEIPFDFMRRRVSVVVQHQGQRYFITKGAPEEVVSVCNFYELDDKISDLTPEARERIENKYRDLSNEGFRCLAVSYKRTKEDKQVYHINDESDMVFLGFVAFIDPPKQTAKKSIRLLKRTGVDLKIVTGDNELVTKNVCERIGIEVKDVVLGSQIPHLQDSALARVAERANVFARVTPVQKDRIMNALKQSGHVVGFLGDGINDAPSMKTADIGISVDNAVDVAKESADIILLHKSLTVLREGVLEGRKTFGNTMKYVMMSTSSSFGNMFSVAMASLFLPFLPMLPIQILLNLQKTKRWDISFVRRFMIVFGPVSSVFDFLTFFIMLYVFKASGPLFQTAWFIESLCTQTLVVFIIRTRKTPFYKSRPSKSLLLASLAVVGVALILPFTSLGAVFEFVRPPPIFFLVLVALIGAYLVLAEIVKKLFYGRLDRMQEHHRNEPIMEVGTINNHSE